MSLGREELGSGVTSPGGAGAPRGTVPSGPAGTGLYRFAQVCPAVSLPSGSGPPIGIPWLSMRE
jgi:hypothetical protein